MSDPNANAAFPADPGGFDSRDSAIIINDEPGDTTVRPCHPAVRKHILEERERLARWLEQKKQSPPPNDPEKGRDDGPTRPN